MKQRVCFAVAFEIIATQVEKDIGNEECRGGYAGSNGCRLGRKVPEETCENAESENSEQGRKDSANSPVVKIRDGVGAVVDSLQNNSGDEIAGNHKENVDAGKAAADVIRE